MIKVLIVDDSLVVRLYLRTLLEKDPEIKVVGEAGDGQDALEKARRLKPDLITMDIRMPVMDGFVATRAIMSECPTPIVVLSSSINDRDLNIAFNALNAGALSIIEKPKCTTDPDYNSITTELIDQIKLMSQIRVIRRRAIELPQPIKQVVKVPRGNNFRLVGFAASTGGPQTIKYILEQLPADFPIPIMIVQHIAKGFIEGMVSWLKKSTNLQLKLAVNHERASPGTVYFCSDKYHLTINNKMTIELLDQPPANCFRPSADIMFKSMAQNLGRKAIGVILTGMGNDGTEGLKSLKAVGGTTIAQDDKSSIVFGMPRSAIESGCVDTVVALEAIPTTLIKLFTT
ncbi:chemotaxis-specific protein-glutamate methyltransferase CheB [bacterium]|nr:chemotaxis-specific protein-glutamate methyltransferase CheB [bacterium]